MAISGLWFGSLYMSGRSWAFYKAKFKGNISRARSASEHQTEPEINKKSISIRLLQPECFIKNELLWASQPSS
jgi:hypothetical protein